jgi:ClpP class serine protease
MNVQIIEINDLISEFTTYKLKNDLQNIPEKIDTLVLKIDSMGGNTLETEKIRNSLKQLKKEKKLKLIAYNAGIMASAGYWIALEADKIYSDSFENQVIGSIGTVSYFYDESPSDIKKLQGVYVKTITSGKKKMFGADEGVTQERVNLNAYNFFTNVSERRGIHIKEIESWQGDIFSSAKALELKLIDGIMPFDNLIKKLTNNDNINNVNSKPLFSMQELDFLKEQLNNLSSSMASIQAVNQELVTKLQNSENKLEELKAQIVVPPQATEPKKDDTITDTNDNLTELNNLKEAIYATAQSVYGEPLPLIKIKPEFKNLEKINDIVALESVHAGLKARLNTKPVEIKTNTSERDVNSAIIQNMAQCDIYLAQSAQKVLKKKGIING